MKYIQLVAAGLLAFALSGCGNLMSIYREDSLLTPSGHVITMDAKQRAILSSRTREKNESGNYTQVYRRYCSEPAPDALTALSMGASGDLGVAGFKNADPDVKLRAALAMSETASTIERTQTINVLREAMFRTCERYLNGSINEDELEIQAARDQRMIVSVLAIEQLTRTVRPEATVLVSGGSNAVYNDPDKVHAWYEEAKKAAEKAKTDSEAADTAFTAANADNGNKCDEAYMKGAEPSDSDEAAKWKTCNQKYAEKTQKASDLTKATATAEDYHTMMEKTALGMSSASGLNSNFHAGGREQRADSASLMAVSGSVARIVERTYDFDEFEMTCMVRLRRVGDEESKPDEASKAAVVNDGNGKFSAKLSNGTVLKLSPTGEDKENLEKEANKAEPADSKVAIEERLNQECLTYIGNKHRSSDSQAQLDSYRTDQAIIDLQSNVLKDYLEGNVAKKWNELQTALGSNAIDAQTPPTDVPSAVALFRKATTTVQAMTYDFIRNRAKVKT